MAPLALFFWRSSLFSVLLSVFFLVWHRQIFLVRIGLGFRIDSIGRFAMSVGIFAIDGFLPLGGMAGTD